jgi:hypothetical protein
VADLACFSPTKIVDYEAIMKASFSRLERLLVILANKDFPFIKTSCVESYLTDGFPMGFKVIFS